MYVWLLGQYSCEVVVITHSCDLTKVTCSISESEVVVMFIAWFAHFIQQLLHLLSLLLGI